MDETWTKHGRSMDKRLYYRLCVSRRIDTLVQQPSRHFPLNLEKIPPNQVIDDFGRGSSVESESE